MCTCVYILCLPSSPGSRRAANMLVEKVVKSWPKRGHKPRCSSRDAAARRSVVAARLATLVCFYVHVKKSCHRQMEVNWTKRGHDNNNNDNNINQTVYAYTYIYIYTYTHTCKYMYIYKLTCLSQHAVARRDRKLARLASGRDVAPMFGWRKKLDTPYIHIYIYI